MFEPRNMQGPKTQKHFAETLGISRKTFTLIPLVSNLTKFAKKVNRTFSKVNNGHGSRFPGGHGWRSW